MYAVAKIENKYVINAATFFLIVVFGIIDYKTGFEFSFSLFYIIPISALALYKNTTVAAVIINAFFAALIWFLAEYESRIYSHIIFPIWNAFVRFAIFASIGLLLLYLKEKQKKLGIVNRNLKALNEEKNRFIGMAAHDLRSPVGGIHSLSDIALEQYKDTLQPEVIEALDYIKSVSGNTLIILENLLDISKIESGKVELQITEQDYIHLLNYHISLNQLIANKKCIKIHLNHMADSILIKFDKNYLGEVIDNLLSNAIKYSELNSEILINVSLSGDHYVLTEVIDKGKGIALEEQQKLFGYFHRTSTQPTSGEKSTGLGLAIARQIITLHKGEIGVRSMPGQGSTFYFTLPV